jgi:hypothetical protein
LACADREFVAAEAFALVALALDAFALDALAFAAFALDARALDAFALDARARDALALDAFALDAFGFEADAVAARFAGAGEPAAEVFAPSPPDFALELDPVFPALPLLACGMTPPP